MTLKHALSEGKAVHGAGPCCIEKEACGASHGRKGSYIALECQKNITRDRTLSAASTACSDGEPVRRSSQVSIASTDPEHLIWEQEKKLSVADFVEAPRAVLGCIQLPTDLVLESEGPRLLESIPGVHMLMQKCEMECEFITAEAYHQAKEDGVLRVAASLLPRDHQCSVVGLSCTSFSFTLGADVVDEQLRMGYPDTKTTDMARAQLDACAALNATKVCLLTPYIEAVSLKNMQALEEGGVTVVRRLTMGLEKDSQTSDVSLECIAEWAEAVLCEEADAVVIGCSAFRACQPGFIDALEARMGKPVVTSTQAFMWKMLRTAGIDDQISGYGSLLSSC